MKKVVIGGVFLALIGIVIFGCQKKEVKLENNPSQKLSMNQLEKIGNEHNAFIVDAINNLKESKQEVNYESIMNEFRNLDISLSSYHSSMNEIVENSENHKYSMIDLREKNLDSNFTEKINYYFNLIDNAVVDDYDQTIQNYNSIKKTIIEDNEVTDFEYNVLIGSIEVGKNSAYLWMKQINTLIPQEKTQRPTSKSTVRADASASMGYMLVVAGTGPFGWFGVSFTAPAFLGTWAVTAAVGSAQHYFGF
jgi:hypothetical protein